MSVSSSVSDDAAAIQEQFDQEIGMSTEDIAERLTTLREEYKVPREEAKRSVINHIEEELGVSSSASGPAGNPTVDVAAIDEPEQWVDLTAEVVELWEPRHESIGQVGLLGDETGTIKFTAWAKSDLPTLKEGATYHLESVVTDEYEGQYSVKLNSATAVSEADEEIEADGTERMVGALVAIQDGSGLIKRCPEEECSKPLNDGRCREHGDVDGEFDLRIKGVIDDGETVQKAIFDRETTEQFSGVSLEEAKQLAMDALDSTVVAQQLREDLTGVYVAVEGPTFGENLLVEEVATVTGEIDTEATLIKARSI